MQRPHRDESVEAFLDDRELEREIEKLRHGHEHNFDKRTDGSPWQAINEAR